MGNKDGNSSSNGNYGSYGNYYSNGNSDSNGNSYSNGNYRSHGNYVSFGNHGSNGNYCSDGNHGSNGNYCSNGNYRSNGNNFSNGNHGSHGNSFSNGNSYSHGNYYSLFLKRCKGTCQSVFCIDEKGIANKAFGQQLNENQAEDFMEKVLKILDGWLPYMTTYQERGNEGWHMEYKESNEYVELIGGEGNDEDYRLAWSKCPKKKELIQLIKDTAYIATNPALEVFEEITGITDEPEELTIEEICKELGREVKVKK